VWGGKALAIALGLLLVIVVAQLNPFVMAWSQYPGGFLRSFAFAALGTAMVLYAASALEGQGWLRTIGINSKAIMAWHLTVFAVLNLMFVALGPLDAGQVGAFTLFDGQRWWPVYLAAAVFVPIGIATAWRRRVVPARVVGIDAA
jgi:fucose 4-O-acetylase-like acetyltransferase